MAQVSGTFTGTGPSESVTGTKFAIRMDFAGTASVDIQERMPSGTWVKVGDSITADASRIYDSPVSTTIRLSCTAYTNAVEYIIQTN